MKLKDCHFNPHNREQGIRPSCHLSHPENKVIMARSCGGRGEIHSQGGMGGGTQQEPHCLKEKHSL